MAPRCDGTELAKHPVLGFRGMRYRASPMPDPNQQIRLIPRSVGLRNTRSAGMRTTESPVETFLGKRIPDQRPGHVAIRVRGTLRQNQKSPRVTVDVPVKGLRAA